MKTILIADDHPIVRGGIKKMLCDNFSDVKVEEASSHGETIKIMNEQQIHLLILDISMPGRSGLETLETVRQLHPEIPVLILSMYPETQFAARVIKAGASGYLSKDNSPDDLIEAVRKILAGGKFISQKVAEALYKYVYNPDDEGVQTKLSAREFQVLKLLGKGFSPTEIAGELNLSIKTISTYRRHILDKLNLRNTADIISFAIKNNLVD